jgi:NAD(P)-dependent dehydrogenase (short-subunit alcohol dehydrogenase family)
MITSRSWSSFIRFSDMQPSQSDNRDRIVLVTGARRGIGAALVLALAGPRRKMIIHVHREAERAEAEGVAGGARTKGADAEIMTADLSSVDATHELARSIIEKHGALDILVNNAARSSYVPIDRITPLEWHATLTVNLTAPFLLAQAALPGMVERGWGRIINVTSITESLGGPSGAAYVSSKGGLVALTRALAHNVRVDGVTVNALSPGAVLTEQEYEFVPEHDRDQVNVHVIGRQSLPRRLVPDDLASAIRFLADEGSNSITGQVIEVNGGWLFR